MVAITKKENFGYEPFFADRYASRRRFLFFAISILENLFHIVETGVVQ